MSRYLFALGRDRVLPHALSRLHPLHGSPYVAGLLQSMLAAAVLAAAVAVQAEPYRQIFPWMSVLGVVGILLVQIAACGAIMRYFRKYSHRAPGFWTATIAPACSAVGLSLLLLMLVGKLQLLASSQSRLVYLLPVLALAIGFCGFLYALGLRHLRPVQYALIGRSDMSDESVGGEAALVVAVDRE